jgi:uncharacterized protein (DUF2147 family)
MQLTTIMTAGFIALMALAPSIHASEPAPSGAEQIHGRWLTESGNLEVDVAPCGQALCGIVAKVLANRSMSAPGNEMQAVDSTPALGMTILKDFTPAGDGEWEGRIYNRENDKTYSCVIALIDSDQLKVRAYKGLRLFGKTQIWRRVSGAAEQK